MGPIWRAIEELRQELAAQMLRLHERLDVLEAAKPKPGRPPKHREERIDA